MDVSRKALEGGVTKVDAAQVPNSAREATFNYFAAEIFSRVAPQTTRFGPKRSGTSTVFRTCCSCCAAYWRARRAKAKCCGGTSGASAARDRLTLLTPAFA